MSLAGFREMFSYLIFKKTKIMLVGTHQRTEAAEHVADRYQ